ncbi:MAG: LLM class F420-dependent oxidoreductase [Chloroflexi bacterium]|nr:LLM class F420-dependent oxidoreductase [Chloroflexota bacterium]
MLEPQEGGTYDEMLDLARRAEALGFGGFFRSDHYHPMNVPLTTDSTDAWTVLAGLARDTRRLRLGTMVSPMTFRYPGEFAKIVATVDRMSGGRIEVGMGAGWMEKEHVAYGLPFPDAKGRMDRLEDALEICTRLWSDGIGKSYEGKQFSIKDAPGYPKPVQRPHPPIIIGGGGARRTPSLTARFADECNVFGGGPAQFTERKQRVEAACRKIGRDPATLRYTWAGPTIVGTDEADLRRRCQIRLDYNNEKDDVGEWIERMRSHGMFIGTIGQVAEQIEALKAVGCTRWYFQFVPVNDYGMLDLIASDLAPKIG